MGAKAPTLLRKGEKTMTPYQITIDWEVDYELKSIIKQRIEVLFENAKRMKKNGCSIKYDLYQIEEYIRILKQINEHSDLNKWNH